jgi:RimJ/RimL family protein N-acetyltransferase
VLKKKLIANNTYIEELTIKYSLELYKLRKEKSLTKFLSSISNDPNDQKKFLKNEKKLGNYFFGIFDNKKKFLGTIGIYNISNKKNAEWGRWICKGNSIHSIESLYLLIKYSFEELKLNTIFCRTLSSNVKVLKIHKKIGLIFKGKNYNDFFINKKYHDSIIYYLNKKKYKIVIKKIRLILNI